jgi:hypothetical protein
LLMGLSRTHFGVDSIRRKFSAREHLTGGACQSEVTLSARPWSCEKGRVRANCSKNETALFGALECR